MALGNSEFVHRSAWKGATRGGKEAIRRSLFTVLLSPWFSGIMRQVGDGKLEDKKTKAEEAEYHAGPRLVTRQIA